MASPLDFGVARKKPGAALHVACDFGPDLADAGTGVTVTGNATVAGVNVTAAHVATTAAGVVTVALSGGRADKVGVVTLTAAYSNGETQVGELLVTPD